MTISGTTRVAAVIGWPVEHSLSPAIHNAAFASQGVDAVYVALAVPPANLPDAVRGIRAQRLLGVSVTVPHKQTVAALCDDLSPLARDIGAVNCLELADGRLIGHNTDASGFVDALEHEIGFDPAGARVMLLGAGGAARAVLSGLTEAGAEEVCVVARSPDRVSWTRARPWTREAMDEIAPRCDLVVDATSTALSAEREAAIPAPIPVDRLPATAAVASLVYHRDPALLGAARRRGLKTLDGKAMLVHQAARAFELWTGQEAPLDAMWRAMHG